MSFEVKYQQLDEIADVIDSLHITPNYSETGIPMVRCVDLNYGVLKLDSTRKVSLDVYNKYSKKYAPKKNDIIITRVGANFGDTSYVGEIDFCLGQNTAAIIPHINKRYVYYVLNSQYGRQKMSEAVAGAAQPTLSLKAIRNLDIPRLDGDMENKVSEILGNLDDKIDLNSQTNQTLEEMAQAIFKSWFVDFDPVKAKMNGEQPEGMDTATASLFPEKLVESELGLIPEGWKASSMGEHFNITMGQSPKGETYNEDGEGIAFFQGRRDFGFRYPDVRVYTTDPKRYAKAGDTLISVRAPVGDKNMADIDCCIGRGVAAIKHKSGSRSFTYSFVSHIEKKLSDSGSSGTVFSSINQNELKKFSFVAPPQALIEAFHKLVDPIDQKVQVLSGEIKSLSELRDTLLPKLLSGEIELAETTI
ncbi:restriction endonuclease subunit S [Shewanella oncorhynchi]|uniref:restriction endonuclease subunit S n=1 Tax=Shewanella oncorhynchi TaxID=2726434 RepID=UPI003D79A93A